MSLDSSGSESGAVAEGAPGAGAASAAATVATSCSHTNEKHQNTDGSAKVIAAVVFVTSVSREESKVSALKIIIILSSPHTP